MKEVNFLNFSAYLLALSGGRDSVYLFQQCVNDPAIKAKLRVVHVHHGLCNKADEWVSFCEQLCAAYEVPFTVQYVTLDRQGGESLEALARQARYHVFEALLGEGEALLTAHHADDQAETVLLQLCRGAGIFGLAAMPSTKPFGKGIHYRPILKTFREEIDAYLTAKNISFIDDPSNDGTDFTRNFLRNDIIPKLATRFPSVKEKLLQAQVHALEARTYIEAHLPKNTVNESGALDIQVLLSYDDITQKMLLRQWVKEKTGHFPSSKHLDILLTEVIHAAPDKHPFLKTGNYLIKRVKSQLIVLPK
jgi:tRNA(Ile)-lysidine synthase